MRDIRTDLKERLQAIERQRGEIQARLAELKGMEEMIAALLNAEEARAAAEDSHLLPLFEPEDEHSNGKYSSPVARFVLEALREKDCDTGELKREAARRGVPFGGKAPGRVLHFLLVGMLQNGLVEKTGRGDWRLKE